MEMLHKGGERKKLSYGNGRVLTFSTRPPGATSSKRERTRGSERCVTAEWKHSGAEDLKQTEEMFLVRHNLGLKDDFY